MCELAREVRRAHGHRYGVRAQHREECDHEFRAVLQVEQHALAAPHPAGLLQVGGETLAASQQLGVAERSALEDRRRLLGEAARGLREQVVHPQPGGRQAARHVGGPVAQVAGFHGAEV